MGEFLHFSISPYEVIVRGTAMYWLLLLIFRFVLRRDFGTAGVPGLLFVVLLGDAAQNGMIGEGHTLADSALLVGVLAGWNYLLDFLAYHVPFVSRLTDPPATLIAKDGRLLQRNLRREHITREEIDSALRSEGLDDLTRVRRMYVEPDGKITVLKKR
ncbi:YetF domain-containing protein [Dokdonella sp.]|uniref:DUF421 domain-containing protein n=1 Tax=Dokdonella sp. TaxID=2291710 RepID=UPI001B2AC9A2|nr:YetF domain-containing protein [Dokdonella sp.]MBO9664013.1 DUF421 domain-containing protein [Dokdonella sp.]